jgi:hypothetical protein
MNNHIEKPDEVSLWRCLHDGGIESIASDLAARTLTIVVDSPFHWDFHKLPPDTRFRLVLEGVRLVEALAFEPSPGQRDYEMGRLESIDWKEFVTQVRTGADYEILQAAFRKDPESACLLKLEVLSNPESNFRELRMRAERLRLFIGQERELGIEAFLEFGDAYWEAFAAKAKKYTSST